MSTIEISPQKHKKYDGRKQDHGDAPSQWGHIKDLYELEYDQRGKAKKDAEQLRVAFEDIDYLSMTPAQLELEADKLLNGTETYTSEESLVDVNQDGFLTEADFGIRSRREVAKLMAQRVTLDPAFERDDMGDDDYNSPIRIRARL